MSWRQACTASATSERARNRLAEDQQERVALAECDCSLLEERRCPEQGRDELQRLLAT
jgi:hypothetical protein